MPRDGDAEDYIDCFDAGFRRYSVEALGVLLFRSASRDSAVYIVDRLSSAADWRGSARPAEA